MNQIELKRIMHNTNGEIPYNGYVKFDVNAINPEYNLMRIKEVMTIISRHDKDNWLSDVKWEEELPGWFIDQIKSHSLEEITRADQNIWDYGSWLDAMKYRGWLWYSSLEKKSGFVIVLEPHTYPFAVDPFEYLIIESGVNQEEILYSDFSR